MIKRLRALRYDGAKLDIVLDLFSRQFEVTMVGLPEEADQMTATARQFAEDGNVRDALIAVRSHGFSLWLEVDEATIQYLIREMGQAHREGGHL